MDQPLAIYEKNGMFAARPYKSREALWAILGPDYNQEMAEALAASLTAERERDRLYNAS